jgi:hypothetical protein
MRAYSLRYLVVIRKFLFFGGIGDLGQTAMAAATASWLAD